MNQKTRFAVIFRCCFEIVVVFLDAKGILTYFLCDQHNLLGSHQHQCMLNKSSHVWLPQYSSLSCAWDARDTFSFAWNVQCILLLACWQHDMPNKRGVFGILASCAG